MQPLKVTCELVGSIAGEVPKLDSIIELQAAHRCDPAKMKPRDEHDEFVPDGVPIPIARRNVDGFAHSIPLCSWPIYVAENDRHEFFNQRFAPPPELLKEKERNVFYGNMGEFRAYRLPLRTRDAAKVAWFCKGEGSKIRRFLSHHVSGVRYLGKKGSIGYGLVKQWTVEPMEEDWSWFAPSPYGMVLMRGLPVSARLPRDLVGFRKWFGGVVAPYWGKKYHVEMVEPC